MTALYMTMTGATLELADDLEALDTTPVDQSCQIIGASVRGIANTVQLPGTLCAPPTEVAEASGATLDLRFLQDWTDPDGICMYLAEHDGKRVAFRLTSAPDDTGGKVAASGTVSAVRPDFLGEVGSPLEATISLAAADVTIAPVTPPAAP